MNDISFAGRYDSFARLDLVFGTQHKAAEALLAQQAEQLKHCA